MSTPLLRLSDGVRLFAYRIIHFSAAAYGVVRLSLTNRFRICALGMRSLVQL